MLSKISLILGISSALLLSSCGPDAPKLTFCVIDGNKPAVYCQDPDGKQYELTLAQANKFVAQPMKDAQALRDYVLNLEKRCH